MAYIRILDKVTLDFSDIEPPISNAYILEQIRKVVPEKVKITWIERTVK